MASEWKTFRLNEVYDFSSGLSKPRSDFGFGYGFLTFKDVFDNFFVPDSLTALVNSTEKERASCSIRRGDVFLTRTSETQDELGMSCVALRDYESATFNGFTKRLRPKPNTDIVPEYAAYFFRSPKFRSDVTAMSSMSTRASLNNEMLERLSIVLPPAEIQTAIGHILKSLDDKIELNRRMNATLEAMAQVLFKSWFVDFDPVKAKAAGRAPEGMDADTAALFPSEFQDSELGPIPKGWRASLLGEEAQRCGGAIQTGPFGSQLHASDYVAQGVPVVMPQHIARRRVLTERIARVLPSDAERLSRHRLQEGDIVYSRRGDVERHALIGKREAGWLCGTGCLLVRLGRRWPSPIFTSLTLDHPESRAWIVQHAVGATMPNLNTGILTRFPLLVPPDDVLRFFEQAAHNLEDRIVANNAESEALANIRDTLLPKLISGQLRIPDAEAMVEAAL